MEPYQQRVFEERDELNAKLEKLLAFQRTLVFGNLPADERERLMRQASCMHGYLSVLTERIFAFPRPVTESK